MDLNLHGFDLIFQGHARSSKFTQGQRSKSHSETSCAKVLVFENCSSLTMSRFEFQGFDVEFYPFNSTQCNVILSKHILEPQQPYNLFLLMSTSSSGLISIHHLRVIWNISGCYSFLLMSDSITTLQYTSSLKKVDFYGNSKSNLMTYLDSSHMVFC